MYKNEIKLLKGRIERLDAESFDLEAWKSATVVNLDRIFGPGNRKSAQIEKIRYEQSSWALRDAKGSNNLIDSCKKQGKEVLLAAIEELQFFGVPDEMIKNQDPLKKVVLGALEQELKIAQMRELHVLLNSDISASELKQQVIDKLNSFDHEIIPNVLAGILTAEETRACLD